MQQFFIVPNHMFTYLGKSYVINIEEMLAGVIDKSVIEALEMIEKDSSALLESHTEDKINQLKLMSKSKQQYPKSIQCPLDF